MKEIIEELLELIKSGASKSEIRLQECKIIENIEEAIKEPSFYSLPSMEIFQMINMSEINDIGAVCKLVENMSNTKDEEVSIQLLNILDPKEFTLNDCIRVVSKFTKSKFCQHINELIQQEQNLLDFLLY